MEEIERPMTIGDLSDKAFLAELQMEFDRAKQALIEHIALYRGQIRSAQAGVTAGITMAWSEKAGVVITTEIKVKTPSAPPKATPAQLKTDTLTGEVNLFTLPPLPPKPAKEAEESAPLVPVESDFLDRPPQEADSKLVGSSAA